MTSLYWICQSIGQPLPPRV